MKYLCLLLLVILPGCSMFHVGAEAVKESLPQGQDVGEFKVGQPYQVQGQWYYPQESYSYDETGIASWYGPGFHGKRTANGETFRQGELTAAHRTLQMPSFVRVTNLDNGKSVVVRINDRGPFARGRIIDVSDRAADLLDFKGNGTARVRVQVMPEASRQVAQAAREGRTWHGTLPAETQVASASPVPTAPALEMAAAPRPYEINGEPIPAHEIRGNFYPDPIVTPRPVPASTSIYVQAGSFSQAANAERLAHQLSSKGRAFVTSANVNGTTYHRVRLGPIESVAEADRILNQIGETAPEAKIVVD
jgi:rare lipoprotein A